VAFAAVCRNAQNLPIAYRISPDGSGSREVIHRAVFNRATAIAVVCLALLGGLILHLQTVLTIMKPPPMTSTTFSPSSRNAGGVAVEYEAVCLAVYEGRAARARAQCFGSRQRQSFH
jgi:hypothetical protein